MSVELQGLELIPQASNMSCWFACLLMMERWQQNRTGSRARGVTRPLGDVAMWSLWDNQGLGQADFQSLARAASLTPVPGSQVHLQSPLTLESYLRCVGPLMLNGLKLNNAGNITSYSHAVILGGTDTSQILQPRVFILDPSPVGIGCSRYVPFAWVGRILADRTTRPVSLLYYPSQQGTCSEPLARRAR
jgi:hypothetical protein